ncbi:hypothetical protein AB9K41_25430 [Cribrihabitans sp. XS_ASV171]
MPPVQSKLTLSGARLSVPAKDAAALLTEILHLLGNREAAEEVLAELRACPPAPGFDRVEIPGERERAQREASGGQVAVPEATWAQIEALAERLRAQA